MDSATSTELTRLSAMELARLIAAKQCSAAEVVEAHIRRIQEVDLKLNAVVVRCFDHARREAARADQLQARQADLAPLHGVPITVKECFLVEGTDATIGVDRLRNQPSTRTSPLVKRLEKAGAIVLGKTNVPQLMAMHEADNPVYGRTNNPWRLDRGPGGSSGGEAAIIAAGGAPLGLGTDLGGSIRQPAHSCGIHGFKPTSHWPPLSGCVENFPGLIGLSVQAGPMARHVGDLSLAMQVLTTPPLAIEGQPYPAPLQWRDPAEVQVDRLRVAVWEDDGCFRPSPAIRRAVREAAAALRDEGVDVVPYTPPAMARMVQLYLGVMTSDGGAELKRLLGRSRRDWRIRRMLRAMALPRWLRPGASGLLRRLGQERLSRAVACSGPVSASAYRQRAAQLMAFAAEFLDDLHAQGFDAVLTPAFGLPALPHGTAEYAISAASYCFLGNVLNAPSGVSPVTRVRADEESDRPDTVDRVERGARLVEEGSAGLPIGVQLIAPPWRDAIVLALMQSLENRLASQPEYPRCPPAM